MEYKLEDLQNETCRSFGGNNCALHQCMFKCVLAEAKKNALKKNGITDETEINKILSSTKKT